MPIIRTVAATITSMRERPSCERRREGAFTTRAKSASAAVPLRVVDARRRSGALNAARRARRPASTERNPAVNYQLRLEGQPPLVFGRVQERVTVPSSFFLMVNVLFVFEVDVSV